MSDKPELSFAVVIPPAPPHQRLSEVHPIALEVLEKAREIRDKTGKWDPCVMVAHNLLHDKGPASALIVVRDRLAAASRTSDRDSRAAQEDIWGRIESIITEEMANG